MMEEMMGHGLNAVMMLQWIGHEKEREKNRWTGAPGQRTHVQGWGEDTGGGRGATFQRADGWAHRHLDEHWRPVGQKVGAR